MLDMLDRQLSLIEFTNDMDAVNATALLDNNHDNYEERSFGRLLVDGKAIETLQQHQIQFKIIN